MFTFQLPTHLVSTLKRFKGVILVMNNVIDDVTNDVTPKLSKTRNKVIDCVTEAVRKYLDDVIVMVRLIS